VNPEKLMDDLMKELDVALKAMSKAKTVEEKVVHSQIVKNLSESLGVFLNIASNLMESGLDDFDEDA
jgi:hypothetical protein